MDIARNLEYQKKYFNEVYNMYFMKTDMDEVALSKEEDYSIEASNYIVIKVESFKEILNNVFHFEEELKDIEKFKEINLKKAIMTETIVENSTIVLPMAFRLNGSYIKLVKKIEKSNLKEVTLVIVDKKKLNLFEKAALKGKERRIEDCNTFEDIKKSLVNFRSYYDEKEFLDNIFKVEEAREREVLGIGIESYIRLDIINKIYKEVLEYDEVDLEKKKYKYIAIVKKMVMVEFERVNNKIAGQFLESKINSFNKEEVFSKNYFVIEELLKARNRVDIELEGILIRFKDEISEILEETEKSNLFTRLNRGELRGLDKLLNRESVKFMDKLRKVV